MTPTLIYIYFLRTNTKHYLNYKENKKKLLRTLDSVILLDKLVVTNFPVE